jgi:hypothetical protein
MIVLLSSARDLCRSPGALSVPIQQGELVGRGGRPASNGARMTLIDDPCKKRKTDVHHSDSNRIQPS